MGLAEEGVLIPEGLCQCGCGATTGIAPHDDPRYGTIKGRPLRYINGHNRRKSHLEYVVDEATSCWVWQRGRSEGYGVMGSGPTKFAHRHYYELHNGPIPEGLHIDHLCFNRACVNPEHLEAVTQAENNRRAHAHRPPQTHCKRGHPLSGDNLRPRSDGIRDCRACERLRGRLRRERQLWPPLPRDEEAA